MKITRAPIVLIHDICAAQGGSVGLNYIQAYLEKNDFTVRSIFFDEALEFIPPNELQKILADIQPAIVGLQIVTKTRMRSFQTIETIHRLNPKTQIIIGGIHTTALYEQILNKFPFVIAVLGEGEQTILELTTALSAGATGAEIKTIAGIAYMHKNSLIKTSQRELIQNLDMLPFPKHNVFLNNKQHWARILTTRGCPAFCSFCQLHTISQRTIRYRSIPNVIAELLHIKQHTPEVTHISIVDDTFLINNNRVIEFCNAVLKHKLHYNYYCSGRFAPISEEMVILMEQAGFKDVGFGLESANDLIREKAHKGITKKDILKTMHIFAKTNIQVQFFFIVGLPGETWETIKETGLFVQSLSKIKYVCCRKESFVPAMVFPNTELYQIMHTAGLITTEAWLSPTHPILYTVEHSSRTLHHMKKELCSYLAPEYFLTFKGLVRQLPALLSAVNRKEILYYNIKQSLARITTGVINRFKKIRASRNA